MKMIHTGDVHLGACPDRGFSWSQGRGQEIWDTFKRLIETAAAEKTELLVVAGDLFHRQPLQRELKELNYLFSRIPDTTVVLTAGNHDYLKKGSMYTTFSWNENVVCLWGQSVEKVTLQGLDAAVYGCSYHSQEVRRNLYEAVRAEGPERYQILLVHGGDDKHSPLDFYRLMEAGFDYVALGHIHKPQVLKLNQMAYCGALEPLDRNDTGMHGYMQVELTPKGTRAEFVPFARRSYMDLELRVEEETTEFALEEMLRQKIQAMGIQHLYRVTLTGKRSGVQFDAAQLQRIGNITEVLDYTEESYDYGRLLERSSGTLLGDYIQYFEGKEDRISRLALEYGVKALLEAKQDS